jgi:GAF domain-containing protein
MSRESSTGRVGAEVGELETLREKVAALEAAHADCVDRIRDLHERNTDLVRLTVAAQRLARSVDREEVLSTIEEIVVELIGSEEFAIFELAVIDGDLDSLRLARVRGISPNSPRLDRASGPIRYALGVGQTLVARSLRHGAEDVDGGLTAAIPLKLDGHVTGAVAIFGLLEHKKALAPVDHELFEILSRQAAMALHSAVSRSLRPTARPPPRTTD